MRLPYHTRRREPSILAHSNWLISYTAVSPQRQEKCWYDMQEKKTAPPDSERDLVNSIPLVCSVYLSSFCCCDTEKIISYPYHTNKECDRLVGCRGNAEMLMHESMSFRLVGFSELSSFFMASRFSLSMVNKTTTTTTTTVVEAELLHCKR